jgi:hypothetical protein
LSVSMSTIKQHARFNQEKVTPTHRNCRLDGFTSCIYIHTL